MPLFDKKIFFSNPIDQFETHRADILKAIEHICTTGPHILGAPVEAFETEFAAWNGVAHAVGVGSGTDALTLALKAFDVGVGDEVITVSHTALATAVAIFLSGAKPVYVDVNPQTCTMDVSKLDAALTKSTKAIIPVHLYGFPCDMDAVMNFAQKNNLIVIEDCAQAHGALYKNKKVGTIGNAGAFSFYPTKNLGAIGDGGGVITNNENVAGRIKQMRQYGWDQNRIATIKGQLSRLDALQAAVLSVKLKSLESDNAKRRAIAATYDQYINWKKFSRPTVLANTTPVYHLYVITAENRDAIRQALLKENVDLGIHYAVPAHKNPAYNDVAITPKDGLTVTEQLSQSVLSLPIYPEFPLSSAQKIAEVLNEF